LAACLLTSGFRLASCSFSLCPWPHDRDNLSRQEERLVAAEKIPEKILRGMSGANIPWKLVV
jgi:hypothetical protein